MGYPSIYPTGVTIYNKEKAYSGYTIFPSAKGALFIDMNGNEVKLWAGLGGFPNKILPGGYVMGTTGARGGKYAYQDQLDLVQVDWDGHIVWKFDKTELVADQGKEPVYMARQHHDFQREGSTVGYYYPMVSQRQTVAIHLSLLTRTSTTMIFQTKDLLTIRSSKWIGKAI